LIRKIAVSCIARNQVSAFPLPSFFADYISERQHCVKEAASKYGICNAGIDAGADLR
jgi:hypothetical protein